MSGLSKIKRIVGDSLTAEGRQQVLGKLSDRLSAKVAPSLAQCHVLASDVLGATAPATQPSPRPRGTSLRIGWIVTPPHAGSGGHTTAFRMVQEMVNAGHSCELVLYDIFGGSLEERAAVIRRGWPDLDVKVRSINDGLDGLDACVATGWQTAYALAARSSHLDMHRLYFIQDYEPFFYPRGYEYELAEATYSLDMKQIALGEMVASHLRNNGSDCATVPFGCDTETYHLTGARERSGIVFYTRPGTSRRGFLLAAMALEEFHRQRPKTPIKVFGPLGRTGFNFPVSWQGLLSPQQLNELYNSSIAGLGMSFTNVSLVVGEMLAAGCVPVVNDSIDARLDAQSSYIRWAAPRPNDVAEALVALVDNPPVDVSAISASTNPSWSVTQEEFRSALIREVTGAED